MTSVLNVDTIAAKDGTSPVALTKQSVAKAWATLDGTGTIAFRDSFGQSAATDNGSGDYTFNFTNAFTDRNRCILLCNNKGEDTSRPYVSQEIYVPTASTCRALFTLANSPTDSDTEDAYMVGLGDLA